MDYVPAKIAVYRGSSRSAIMNVSSVQGAQLARWNYPPLSSLCSLDPPPTRANFVGGTVGKSSGQSLLYKWNFLCRASSNGVLKSLDVLATEWAKLGVHAIIPHNSDIFLFVSQGRATCYQKHVFRGRPKTSSGLP